MAVNMRDVASVAGVSQRTVSNVVNDYVYVSPATRQRVQQAIERLNYRPNISAQKLRNGRTGIVALAVPEIRAPYFAELADHLQRYAAARGITLLIDQTGGTRERELLVLDGYRSTLVDGLILNPLAITAHDLTQRPLDVPVVLLGESIDHSGYLHVSVDNVAAAEAATQHLIATGRRRIAAVGGHLTPGETGPDKRRLQGYIQAISATGLRLDTSLIFDTSIWNRAEGYAVAARIADPAAGRPRTDIDALFCFNDSLALGALKALQDHGVRVPDDIAVIGWDDIEEAAYSTPTLTTIAPDKAQIAAQAVEGLLAAVAGRPADPAEISSAFTLQVRGSTSPSDGPTGQNEPAADK